MLNGTLRGANGASNVTGRLRGDQITLSAGAVTYTGRVNGNSMEGKTGSIGWSGDKLR